MTDNTRMVLSVLIISHNQRDVLPRCLKSVLRQELNVPYEIIISDDRSTDGTWEMIELYQEEFQQVRGIKCNSDECQPVNTSERCGWNKLNAYEQATGKYFVNIDADDYLIDPHIYQQQIDMLEAHSECSMCMQRVLSLHDGEPLEKGNAWPHHPSLINGHIIPASTFLRGETRGLNQVFMIKRHPEDDMRSLYGKWFDDTIITYHHFQYGPVVFIDRCDYAWIQSAGSISHDISPGDNLILNGLLPVHHAMLIPALSDSFIAEGADIINHTLKRAPSHPELREDYRRYFAQFNAFIYSYYTEREHHLNSIVRFLWCRCLLLAGLRFKKKSKAYIHLLKGALI